MAAAFRLMGLLAVLGAAGCQNIDLDPNGTRHELPKETGPIIRPPPELVKGSAI